MTGSSTPVPEKMVLLFEDAGNAIPVNVDLRPTSVWLNSIFASSRRTVPESPFARRKFARGLERACWKRPIPTTRVEEIIGEIAQEVYSYPEPEIKSLIIGEMVMEKLIELDDVAYIRFASVYRQFKDIHDFVAEVRPILDRNQLRVEKDRAN